MRWTKFARILGIFSPVTIPSSITSIYSAGMNRSKSVGFCGVIGLVFLCCVFFFFLRRNDRLSIDCLQRMYVRRSWKKVDEMKKADVSTTALTEIQQVLNLQRRMIRNEMMNYRYPNGSKLKDLLIEENGNPMKSVIVARVRSGSTFLGDIVAAHPATFYHSEPLLDFGAIRITDPALTRQALDNLKRLLNCEYADLDHYIEHGKTEYWNFRFNSPLWTQCQAHQSICYDYRFLSGMCKLFPFQSMKIARLKLHTAKELLADKKLAVRLVLLVRDPRGILQSRKHTSFCRRNPDCLDPDLLCADLVSDYIAAVELQKKYPSTFRVLRYEDLSVEPYKQAEELFKFYGLDFHPSVKKFLDTHTKNDVGDVYSTYRNSKKTPFHWRTDLEFEEVEGIQRKCLVAMKHWGYIPAVNASHQREFNPVTDYVLQL